MYAKASEAAPAPKSPIPPPSTLPGSALEEGKQGEVHLVDFALFTDASGVAAEIGHAHLPSWQVAADSSGGASWGVGGAASSTAHDESLLKRTVFVKGATRTQLRHFTALRTTLAVCGNVAQARHGVMHRVMQHVCCAM